MLNSTKRLYKIGKGINEITISFPNLNISYTTKDIEENNVSLNEALMNNDNIEFVGCISNYFQARIHGASAELKDQPVVVTMNKKGINDPCVIFRGYVYNAKTRSDLAYKEITCYDALHQKVANKEIAGWYKALPFPMTMKDLRNRFFSHVGITQKSTALPNDSIVIDRQYNPELLNALDFLKNICQFNGTCGIMNRAGEFEYRTPMGGDTFYMPYPSNHTYPSAFYPGGSDDLIVENFYYKTMQYEEFLTNKITRVEVRDDNKSQSYGYGSGTNKYIIQGNVFVYGLSDADKVKAAQNIYNKIKNFQYRPVTYESPGLPFAEVGSMQSFYAMDWLNGSGEIVKRSFPLLNRTLSGISELTDKCNIRGKKEQTEFVSDLSVKINLIEKSSDNYYTKDQIDSKLERDYYTKPETQAEVTEITDTAIAQMETPTGLAFASVYALPGTTRTNTLYGIQGLVIVQ